MAIDDLRRAVVQADIDDANLPQNRGTSWGQINRRHAEIAVRTVLLALAEDIEKMIRMAGEEGVPDGAAGRLRDLIAEARSAHKPS